MKTCDIDVDRLKAVRHDHGVIEVAVDVRVVPRSPRDEGPMPTSTLRLPVEHARTLLLLLKQQLAELDRQQPRSRRSGRS